MITVKFNPDALIRFRGSETQTRIARRLGISPQLYRAYELGTCPGGDKIFLMQRIFGLSMDDLFIVSDPCAPPQAQPVGESMAMLS